MTNWLIGDASMGWLMGDASMGWLMGGGALGWPELAQLFAHFFVLSLISVGGAINTASDMQRFVVQEHGWLSAAQFNTSVAIAQASPGPNVLFVAVLGFNLAGLAGLVAAMSGIMLPSTVLALKAGRLTEQYRESRAIGAFNAGLGPLSIGLLLSTGWVLLQPYLGHGSQRIGALALAGVAVLVMVRTKLSPIWLIGLGALVGALGGV